MERVSCWTIIKCGKEDACPAYPDKGAKCWTVEGTLCRELRSQGGYSDKIGECRKKCKFYDGVMMGRIKVV